MSPHVTFNEVLDAVERLPPEQQAELLALIQRRLAEQGRKRVAEDVQSGRAEFESGAARRARSDEIVDEIESCVQPADCFRVRRTSGR